MNKKSLLINLLQYIFFTCVGIILLYFAFRSINFKDLIQSILSTRLDYLIVSLLFGLLGMLGRSVRWLIMIETLGYRIPLMSSYHALMIGYTANYAFPRIGEITRCGILNRIEKVPVDSLIGTVIAERAWDVFMLLILTFSVVLLKIKIFGDFFNEKIIQPLSIKFNWIFQVHIFVWIIIFVSFFSIFAIVLVYRNVLKVYLLRGKIGQFTYGIYHGIKSVIKIKRRWEFFGITIFIWLVYILMTYFALKAMTPTQVLDFVDAFFIMVVGSYGFVVPVQGGIGAYHGIVALGLSLYAISWNDALAYALLSHGSQAISIILLGLFSFVIITFKNNKTEKFFKKH